MNPHAPRPPLTWTAAVRTAADPTSGTPLLAPLTRVPALERFLAGNPNTTGAQILELAPHYPDEARANPSLALAFLTDGAGREDDLARLLDPNAAPAAPEPYSFDWPADHPAYANPTLTYGSVIDELLHRYGRDDRALEHLARNPNIASHLPRLAVHPNPDVRYNATNNPAVSADALLELAIDFQARHHPHASATYAALARRDHPTGRAWLRTHAHEATSAHHLLDQPPAPPPTWANPPRGRIRLACDVRRLRDRSISDPASATPDLVAIAKNPLSHPASRARAALSCREALEAARGTDLFAHLPAGPLAEALARALRDATALALVERAVRERVNGPNPNPDSSVWLPF